MKSKQIKITTGPNAETRFRSKRYDQFYKSVEPYLGFEVIVYRKSILGKGSAISASAFYPEYKSKNRPHTLIEGASVREIKKQIKALIQTWSR